MLRNIVALALAGSLAAAPAYAQMGHGQQASQKSGPGMACPGMPGMMMRAAGMMGMHGGGMQMQGPGMTGMMGMMHGGTGGMMGRPMSQMQGMMGAAMMGHGMMMGAAGPGMLLRVKGTLDLTDAQVSRLEALQQKLSQEHEQHETAAGEAQRAAAEALSAEQPDLAAFQARLQEAAGHRVQAHVAAARAAVEARAVLTDEQRAKLHSGMAMMRDIMCSMMGGEAQTPEGSPPGGDGAGSGAAHSHGRR